MGALSATGRAQAQLSCDEAKLIATVLLNKCAYR
jgi:hypothetical protein